MIRFWTMAAFALLGAAVLLRLGLWQLDRAEWKAAEIARIEAALLEAPADLPAVPEAAADAYRAVRAAGRVTGAGVPIFSTWRGAGPGYRIVVPFEAEGGRRVLLDLGVAAAPDVALPEGPLDVVGNLHWPGERQGDPAAGTWTARDLPQLAARLGTEPVLIVARRVEPPVPVVGLVPLDAEGIPDNHLGYAVQWFGLALVWTIMAVWFMWRIAPWRRGRPAEG